MQEDGDQVLLREERRGGSGRAGAEGQGQREPRQPQEEPPDEEEALKDGLPLRDGWLRPSLAWLEDGTAQGQQVLENVLFLMCLKTTF